MLQLTVTGTEALTRRLLEIGQDAPKAASRAVNKALSETKTAVVRMVTKETGITRGSFLGTKKNPTDYLTEQKANYSNQVGTLAISKERIPLLAFKARGPEPSRGKGSGVSYSLPKGRGRIPEAFIATMRSGHRGVFVKVFGPLNRMSPGAWSFNLPIVEQFGPSPGRIIEDNAAEVRAIADAALQKHMSHEIDWIIQQRVAAGDE